MVTQTMHYDGVEDGRYLSNPGDIEIGAPLTRVMPVFSREAERPQGAYHPTEFERHQTQNHAEDFNAEIGAAVIRAHFSM